VTFITTAIIVTMDTIVALVVKRTFVIPLVAVMTPSPVMASSPFMPVWTCTITRKWLDGYYWNWCGHYATDAESKIFIFLCCNSQCKRNEV
jgi:hypothetical protein